MAFVNTMSDLLHEGVHNAMPNRMTAGPTTPVEQGATKGLSMMESAWLSLGVQTQRSHTNGHSSILTTLQRSMWMLGLCLGSSANFRFNT